VLIRLRVFGPSESREPRPNPSNEGNDDDTQPGNTPARLSPQRSGFQGTWGRLGGAAHGLSRQKLVPCTDHPTKECPVAPSGTDHASAAGTCQKRHPIGLMETDDPNVHRHTQK
jgi:hypothetical protein